MKEVIIHILEIVASVIAVFALIMIITMMTKTGVQTYDENGRITLQDAGIVTNEINDTITSVFDKTDEAIRGTGINDSEVEE